MIKNHGDDKASASGGSTDLVPNFDVKQYSDLQKSMSKEEYMRFVMNKFLECKYQAKQKVYS